MAAAGYHRAMQPGIPAFLEQLWRVLRTALLGLAALVLFIEESGWRPLAAWIARLAQWPPIARLEARIRKVSPRLAIALFFAPMVLLLPVKFAAVWLIAIGRAGLGITIIVIAKLLGTAFVGRLFVLVEPQLMSFRWFARSMWWWRQTRLRIIVALHASALWRNVRHARDTWRQWVHKAAR